MIEIKLVIVEDDKQLLKQISRILKREISEVYSLSSPEEALKRIPEIHPDIILSDINMPKMSGIDMYKELQNKNIDIPIILASAFTEPKYFLEAIRLKVKNFIIKPINVDHLLSEIKNFEKELIEKKEHKTKEDLFVVQSRMAAMGEMLTNIAHQWKQPLNTISLCASSLQLDLELKPKNYEEEFPIYINHIIDSVKYMSTTIEDFQDYLKPNKLETCFYLKETFKKVEKLIDIQCKTNNITIIKNITNTNFCSYQNELIQVILNILKNSIDELIKKEDLDKYIFIDVYNKDKDIIIEIKDNAGGIDPSIINLIFNPYFSTKKDKGTGIGLYMSKQIIENLNGKIEVDNSIYFYNNINYTGAIFTITLSPIKKELTIELEN
ncbi:hybrid sensor histidine kinase/response regulator [bacterium]|nr:hybrid sensor histidine kinase/response regulator [bacterium]